MWAHGSLRTHVRSRKSSVQMAQHWTASFLPNLNLFEARFSNPGKRLFGSFHAAGRGSHGNSATKEVFQGWATGKGGTGLVATARSSELEFVPESDWCPPASKSCLILSEAESFLL